MSYEFLNVLLVRYVAAKSTKIFFKDRFNLMEVAALTPQWIPATLLVINGEQVPPSSAIVEGIAFSLAVWKAMRIVPFIRSLRGYRSMRMMAQALAASSQELVFLAIVLFVGSVLFGYAIYVAEIYTTETEMHGLVEAMWWGVITMTTVGYGDLVPTTYSGNVVGFVCAITGILMVALPVPIIATKFYQINDHMGITDLSNKLLLEDIEREKAEEEAALREALESGEDIDDIGLAEELEEEPKEKQDF